jgi:hypothetical protein
LIWIPVSLKFGRISGKANPVSYLIPDKIKAGESGASIWNTVKFTSKGITKKDNCTYYQKN